MHKNKTEETATDHLEFNEMFRRNEAIVYNFIRYRILDKFTGTGCPARNILPGVQEMGYSQRSSESDGMAVGDREV